jgi:hypothetical protein
MCRSSSAWPRRVVHDGEVATALEQPSDTSSDRDDTPRIDHADEGPTRAEERPPSQGLVRLRRCAHAAKAPKARKMGRLAVPPSVARALMQRLQPAGRQVPHGHDVVAGALALEPRRAQELVEAAAERAAAVVEAEEAAAAAERRRARLDRLHGVRGLERADYQGHVAPAWLGAYLCPTPWLDTRSAPSRPQPTCIYPTIKVRKGGADGDGGRDHCRQVGRRGLRRRRLRDGRRARCSQGLAAAAPRAPSPCRLPLASRLASSWRAGGCVLPAGRWPLVQLRRPLLHRHQGPLLNRCRCCVARCCIALLQDTAAAQGTEPRRPLHATPCC